MTYTEAEALAHPTRSCPSCGNEAEQRWLDVGWPRFPGTPGKKEFIPGLFICSTRGCEYGPPVKPEGCTCSDVWVTRFKDEGSRFDLSRDRDCPVHARVAEVNG